MQNLDSAMYMLQQLSQGAQSVWMQAVYLAGMFAALLWKRESVENWALFRFSFLFFAASMIVPPIVTPFLQQLIMQPGRGYIGPGDSHLFTQIAISAMWPILFSLAVVFGLTAMMPRALIPYRPPAPPMPAPPHPLD